MNGGTDMTDKLDGLSLDLEKMNKEKLQSVFPECFIEGKLDIDKLLSLCGEYINDDYEKYEFKWKGKSDCLRLAQKRSTSTLRPCPAESVDFDTTQNLYIEGDNLEVLKLLQKSYFRKVKMIYIDPPYNTGNDFVYADNFADPLARYKEVTEQTTKSNPETMGRYHTNWLNMMYPRLRLAANLLKDDGVIFISIDDGEVSNLRKLCDEVFGEENFVANIMWQKRYSPANDHKTICPMHDFIVVYRKSEAWQRNLLPRSKENDKQYRYEDDRGVFRASDYKCNKTADQRPNLYYPIINPNTGEEIWPSTNAVWRYSKERHEENVRKGLVFWGKDGKSKTPAFKRYRDTLAGGGGVVPTTWWTYEFAGHNDSAAKETGELIGNRVFSTPKPTSLLMRILQLSTLKDGSDIILDFFSGSATTAHAVMQLNAEDGGNRRYIMVQLPEVCDEKSEAFKAGYKNICEIGKERIRRAGAKILEEAKQANSQLKLGEEPKPLPDVGFKVFKLDSSNLKIWDDSLIDNEDIATLFDRIDGHLDGLKPDRSNDELVFEILLKMGYPLTSDLSAFDLNGLTVYTVENNEMLICLQPGVTAEHVEQMAAYQPKKIVLASHSLADSSAKANAYYLLENQNIELKTI